MAKKTKKKERNRDKHITPSTHYLFNKMKFYHILYSKVQPSSQTLSASKQFHITKQTLIQHLIFFFGVFNNKRCLCVWECNPNETPQTQPSKEASGVGRLEWHVGIGMYLLLTKCTP